VLHSPRFCAGSVPGGAQACWAVTRRRVGNLSAAVRVWSMDGDASAHAHLRRTERFSDKEEAPVRIHVRPPVIRTRFSASPLRWAVPLQPFVAPMSTGQLASAKAGLVAEQASVCGASRRTSSPLGSTLRQRLKRPRCRCIRTGYETPDRSCASNGTL
jgi:hypothetical protein